MLVNLNVWKHVISRIGRSIKEKNNIEDGNDLLCLDIENTIHIGSV